MQRQIVLDTETTGLRTSDGHRIIEIGAIEIVDRKISNNTFHHYFNPQREIDAGAQQVHGISLKSLADKPLIASMLDDFLAFVQGAEVIIHNASFDVGFINHELQLAEKNYRSFSDYCTVTDSLKIARKKHSGRGNTLDRLCERYGVDSSERTLHGALLDARLLAEVYLKMTSGQKQLFVEEESQTTKETNTIAEQQASKQHFDLPCIIANEHEQAEHIAFLQHINQQTKCLWPEAIPQETETTT